MTFPSTPVAVEESTSTYVTGSSGNVTTTGAQIVAARNHRKTLIIFNPGSVNIYFSLGSACTVTNATGFVSSTDRYFVIDKYEGPVWAVVAAATETLFVTELL